MGFKARIDSLAVKSLPHASGELQVGHEDPGSSYDVMNRAVKYLWEHHVYPSGLLARHNVGLSFTPGTASWSIAPGATANKPGVLAIPNLTDGELLVCMVTSPVTGSISSPAADTVYYIHASPKAGTGSFTGDPDSYAAQQWEITVNTTSTESGADRIIGTFLTDSASKIIRATSYDPVSESDIDQDFLSNLPGYIHGCNLTPNTTTKINLENGTLEVDTAAGDDPEIVSATTTPTMDFATTGVNGLDTGSPAIGFYHMFAIYNPTASYVGALSSLSATSPTLPSGYTKFRRVGAFYNLSSGSANIRPFKQVGKGAYRWTYFAAVNVGTALAQQASWTSLSISSAVPTTADVIAAIGGTSIDGEHKAIALAGDSNGLGASLGITGSGSGYAAVDGFYASASHVVPIKTAQTVYYKNLIASPSCGRISVTGYGESV